MSDAWRTETDDEVGDMNEAQHLELALITGAEEGLVFLEKYETFLRVVKGERLRIDIGDPTGEVIDPYKGPEKGYERGVIVNVQEEYMWQRSSIHVQVEDRLWELLSPLPISLVLRENVSCRDRLRPLIIEEEVGVLDNLQESS